MSVLFFRPVVAHPTRCSAPAFFTRPSLPSQHDFAPLFSLFSESLAQLENSQRQVQPQLKRIFNPKFDVKETQGAYSVEGELPGFDAKDISIEFVDDGHTLQIKGKTTRQNESRIPSIEDRPTNGSEPVDTVPTDTSEASNPKSHQATVEDDVEESATASESAATPQDQSQAVSGAVKSVAPQVEKTQEKQDSAKHWVTERYSGSFSRSFKFPSQVDQEAVHASLKDGILAITLPFARKPESRRIQIE